MDSDSLIYRIKRLICEKVAPEIELESIGNDDMLIEDLNFDSLQILGLITEMEREFGFMLDDEDLDLEALVSVSSVSRFVAQKLDGEKSA
ncbi:MAG: acyl carrier protein [Gammaproteobacteria bacterium]|nr:acyl carrier protein [Gammaproteobacteria bacterium]